MSGRKDTLSKLNRIAEALARDVDAASDAELLAEAAEEHGTAEAAVEDLRNTLKRALDESGRQRLIRARQGYDQTFPGQSAKVIQLPLERKRALLERFAKSGAAGGQKVTLAARNEADSEADVDSLLEDLLELGAIDEEGNIK